MDSRFFHRKSELIQIWRINASTPSSEERVSFRSHFTRELRLDGFHSSYILGFSRNWSWADCLLSGITSFRTSLYAKGCLPRGTKYALFRAFKEGLFVSSVFPVNMDSYKFSQIPRVNSSLLQACIGLDPSIQRFMGA